MTPRERKPNDRRITGPYAGAVCPKCGQGMNHKQNITLSQKEEERDRKRYGSGICDDCKLERGTLYDIVDKEGSILSRHYSGRGRTLKEATEMIEKLNKNGEYRPYTLSPIRN